MDGAVDFTHLLFFVYAEYRLLIGVAQDVNEEHHVSAKITVRLFRYRHIFIVAPPLSPPPASAARLHLTAHGEPL